MHSYFQQPSAIFLESQRLSGILIFGVRFVGDARAAGCLDTDAALSSPLVLFREAYTKGAGRGCGICASYPVHVGKKKDGYVLLIRSMYSSWSNRIGWLDSAHPNRVEVWVLDFHRLQTRKGGGPSSQHGHERSGERNSRASAA